MGAPGTAEGRSSLAPPVEAIPSPVRPKPGQDRRPPTDQAEERPGLISLDGAVDDDRILSEFEAAATEAFLRSQARPDRAPTSAATLWQQLDRERCRVPLPPPATRPLSPEEVYSQAKQSTLIFGAFKGQTKRETARLVFSGAAFPLTADGVIVTNYHLVAPMWKRPKKETKAEVDFYAVTTSEGTFATVTEILAADEGQDLAIARVSGGTYTPRPLGPIATPGAWVGLVSHPDLRFFSYQQGHITRRYATMIPTAEGLVPTVWYSSTCELAEGSSGGPLLDRTGNVVGLAAFTETVFAMGHLEERPARSADPLTVVVPPAETQMIVRSFCPAEAIRALIEP